MAWCSRFQIAGLPGRASMARSRSAVALDESTVGGAGWAYSPNLWAAGRGGFSTGPLELPSASCGTVTRVECAQLTWATVRKHGDDQVAPTLRQRHRLADAVAKETGTSIDFRLRSSDAGLSRLL